MVILAVIDMVPVLKVVVVSSVGVGDNYTQVCNGPAFPSTQGLLL